MGRPARRCSDWSASKMCPTVPPLPPPLLSLVVTYVVIFTLAFGCERKEFSACAFYWGVLLAV